MRVNRVIDYLVEWLNEYCNRFKFNGFVVGISGGIDSAVTSVLCAKTGKKTLVTSLPILQIESQFKCSSEHISWITNKFGNVEGLEIELTPVFDAFQKNMPSRIRNDLTMANSRSRIRMIALYALASIDKLLVVGTGNKVEDFGIGFYTKYGDGGVDLSPIAELMKSQIKLIAKTMGISDEIIEAEPNDGLWNDGRSDESQIGASYDELEWAMNFVNGNKNTSLLNEREKVVLNIYNSFHEKNLHKMLPIPVCSIPKELL